ncbi:hypothetical protein NPIL_268481 [Nephila pilipes]|uniref:Uncharacterized protein n=1 Tax=Nephila pilipes TaxID=299642 RepID=A0A8X6U6V9_NEPPI|nr:hypothetical protein NPIL_268481 [Nephila pilipes]
MSHWLPGWRLQVDGNMLECDWLDCHHQRAHMIIEHTTVIGHGAIVLHEQPSMMKILNTMSSYTESKYDLDNLVQQNMHRTGKHYR